MDHIINIELSMYCVLCKRCVCHARTIWSNLLLKARALQSTATKRFIFARLLFLYNGRVEYNYTTLASSVRWKFFSTLYVLPKRSRFFCEMKVHLHSLRPTETFSVLLTPLTAHGKLGSPTSISSSCLIRYCVCVFVMFIQVSHVSPCCFDDIGVLV